MSANHVRRRQTGRHHAADLGRRRTEKVLGLLALRDRLARAVAEFEAHDFEGSTDVFQQQLDTESIIRALAPGIYQKRWTEWLERDSQLAHTPESPHPVCLTCLAQAQRAVTARPSNRAS